MTKDEDQIIKATLSAFGPDEGVRFAQDTWAKLHAAMSAVVAQPAPDLQADLVKANAQAEHFEREWYLRGDELEATNRQVEILSDALAESRREVAALKAVQEPVRLQCVHCGTVYADGVPPAVPAPVQEPTLKDVARDIECVIEHCKLYNNRFYNFHEVAEKIAERLGERGMLATTPPAVPAPVQEPVAWIFKPNRELLWPNEVERKNPLELNEYAPLYTTPPAAQRQWVGLTEHELESLWYQAETGGAMLLRFAEAIEDKLKEKNT
jgi:hypothetical protein